MYQDFLLEYHCIYTLVSST